MQGIDELIKKLANQLNARVHDPSINQALVTEAKVFMDENPESRVKLGPLIGKLTSMPTQALELDLSWVKLLNGSIAVGHRPKVKMLKNMRAAGTTHIFTLLSEKEGAKDVGSAVKKNDLTWLWLPLSSAEPPEQAKFQEIDDVFCSCVNALKNGAKIYIHCSAGIHRTGMIAYALFRYLGLDAGMSTTLLQQLRQVTAQEVGEHRKAWGDSYYNRISK